MKYVVTDDTPKIISKEAIYFPFQPKMLSLQAVMTAGLLLASVAFTSAQAASQGRLGSESSGSVGITLRIHDRLNVQSSEESPANQVTTSSSQSSGLGQTLCVQGTGVDHYSLSVSGSNGDLVLSNDNNDDIPYQVTWNSNGDKVIIPAGDDSNRLVIKTDASCDNPSSVKVDISDQESLDQDDYSGAAILNINVE